MQIEACYFYRHPQFLKKLYHDGYFFLKYLAKKELERRTLLQYNFINFSSLFSNDKFAQRNTISR